MTLVTIDALTLSLSTDFVWHEGATLSDPSATKRQRMWWDALTIMGALPGLSATQPEPASSMKQDDNPPSTEQLVHSWIFGLVTLLREYY